MNRAYKVLWREGLFLTPQHFQALDKRHEWLAAFHTQTVFQYYWGLHKLEMDTDAIANWQLTVKSIKAVMRDGTPLDCPDTDQTPPSRSFEKLLTPDKQSLIAYLCIPREDEGRPGVRMTDEGSGERTRHERLVREVRDYVTGSKPREIEFVAKKPEIRFEGEELDAFDILPLAKIQMKDIGRPALSHEFLPPCLTLAACSIWTDLVRTIFQQVNSLGSELRSKLTYDSESTVNITIPDLPIFLKTRELMRSLPALIHFYNAPESHPFHFYQAITDLTVRLGVIFDVFGENCADDLPPYNHDAPGEGLQALLEKVQTMFGLIPRTRKGVFSLEPVPDRENIWSCSLTATQFADNVEFYIWASSDLPDNEFTDRFAREFRLASPDRIDQLITFAVPGVTLSWVASPPVMLPAPQKGHYFRLNTRHEEWPAIVESKALSIAGPKVDFPNLKVRLHELRP